MQAIQTKYFGPSNARVSRIKAKCSAGSAFVSYDHELNVEENHRAAAFALIKKLGWHDQRYMRIVTGGTEDGGYAHVFEPVGTAALRNALGNLCQHAQGNRGNRSGNPYSIPEMQDALKALYEDATGCFADDFSAYCDASAPWKKSA